MGIVGLSVGIVVTGFAPSLHVSVAGLDVSGFFDGGLNAMIYLLSGELTDVDPEHVGTMAGVVLSLSNVGAVAATIAGAQVLTVLGVEAAALVLAAPALLGLYGVARLPFGHAEVKADASAVVPEVD